VYAGSAMLIIVILVVAYTYQSRIHGSQGYASDSDGRAPMSAASSVRDLFSIPPTPPQKTSPTPTSNVAAVASAAAQPDDPTLDARRKAWARYYDDKAKMDQAKDEAFGKALQADTDPSSGVGASSAGSSPQIIAGQGTPVAAGGGAAIAGTDAAGQAEKRSFLGQQGDPLGLNEDLIAVKHGPKPDTIMEGTAIPAVMVGGLNSDMPGQVVGSIAENIYDTASGNDLLIPQGSRVVGDYDNSVSYGQTRIGVIWKRIIFPDSSSLQLGAMEGADQGGYAGFHDRVNTHFWDKFWSALLISIAGAGSQLSQPQPAVNGFYSPGQIGAAAMAQGFSQVGQEYARAGLSIPNTLEVRPGYAFRIMVMKDIHLPPYVDRRSPDGSLVSAAALVLQ
jgi:type IV secretion system protein VirB10